MSNPLTAYNPITVRNFTGAESLTGYSLPVSNFTFVLSSSEAAPVTQFSTNNILWDFGDGVQSTGLTARHAYNFPGVYNVTTYLYNSAGEVYNNTFTVSVSTLDFITDSLNIIAVLDEDCIANEAYICIGTEELDVDNNVVNSQVLLLDPLQSNLNRVNLRAGRIETPFVIQRTNSWQSWNSLSGYSGYPINLYSKGADANFFDQKLNTNKYGHLYKYSSFYKLENNEFIETTSTTTDNTVLYCKLSSGINVNTIVFCDKDDYGSVICGTSGIGQVYFKADTPVDQVILYASFDSNVFNDLYGAKYYPFKYGSSTFGYLNVLGIGLSATVLPNAGYSSFTLTSNGLDGEGQATSIFNIDKNKFLGIPLNFIVKIKDENYFTIKNNANLALTGSNNVIDIDIVKRGYVGLPQTDQILNIGSISANFGQLSALSANGFFRGQVVFNQTADNICLRVTGRAGLPLEYNLIGYSSTFSVYPSSGAYHVAKKNEDFDFESTLKDLRFQDYLINDDVLFTDFFGSIYGNLSSSPHTLGKTAYEKIANFVDNKVNIYTCDVESLYSIGQMLNYNVSKYDRFVFRSPATVRRLVDLFSINRSRLWGTRNSYNLNFNPRYNVNPELFGKNLGTLLDISTTVLTANQNFIIAYEKYSDRYKLCPTYIAPVYLTEYNSTLSTFPLSSYKKSWGWPLDTADVEGIEVGKYYAFYSYVPTGAYLNNTMLKVTDSITVNNATGTITGIDKSSLTIYVDIDGETVPITGNSNGVVWKYGDNTIVNNVINFDDITNTLSESLTSYSNWVEPQGIIDNMLNYSLYNGLKLFDT